MASEIEWGKNVKQPPTRNMDNNGAVSTQSSSISHPSSAQISTVRRGGIMSSYQQPQVIMSTPNIAPAASDMSNVRSNLVYDRLATEGTISIPSNRNIHHGQSALVAADAMDNRREQRTATETLTTIAAGLEQKQQQRRNNSQLIARTQFCQFDVLACINCATPDMEALSWQQQQQQQIIPPSGATASTTTRKLGPLLLDLRSLHYCPMSEIDRAQSLFSTSIIAQSRGNPSLGTSVASTCLSVSSNHHDGTIPGIATGLTTGALCIHSFLSSSSNADPAALSPYEYTSTIEYYQLPRNNRPATAVAWRPNSLSHVVIGYTSHSSATSGHENPIGNSQSEYLLSRSQQPPQQVRRTLQQASVNMGGGGLSANPAAAGDREYCCFLWDVEYQPSSSTDSKTATSTSSSPSSRRTKTAPLYKLSHNTGVASMNWILDDSGGQILAVGGQHRNVQLYDLRISGTTTASSSQPSPISVFAHAAGVHGIESDPSRPCHFCTYSHGVGEVVKLWDARRMESPLSEIKVGGMKNSTTAISTVQWCTVEPGQLSILVGDNTIHKYDTFTASSRPTHTTTIRTRKPTSYFIHYPNEHLEYSGTRDESISEETKRQKNQVFSELFRKEIVVVESDQTVNVVAAHRIAPIQLSPRTGQLVHTLGPTLWLGSASEGPAAMESSKIRSDEDISATMLRRARCLHVAKYSMDISSNIEMLALESSKFQGTTVGSSTEQLLRLWRWIQLAEAFCHADGTFDEVPNWPAKSLSEAGVAKLLELDKGKPEQCSYSSTLFCSAYDSVGRRAALASCGWAGMFDLASVMADCESGGEFERSAALAVWHGDIGAAVDALERGATQYERNQNSSNKNAVKYAETLELVSLSIAGYQGGDYTASTTSVWRRACGRLLERPDLSDPLHMPSGAGYLRHVLKFLMTIGIDDSHNEVMTDSTLSLCDRVAFACRFLSNVDLMLFVEKCISDCQSRGNVEGIAITGIEMNGIKILQSYVDFTADVQTAALVTSRVVLPVDWLNERRIVAEWLHSYRFLLNRWQMWQSRAMFDVDRASLLRQVKMRQQTERGKTSSRNRQIPRIRSVDSDVQATIPAQLDARCNYCSSPLGLRRQDNQPNQWLSKMKNVLPCCPRCRKPLPRCAICMLTLGALNPYYELTKDRTREAQASNQAPDDLSSLANLPFAEWFSWCFRCKHGGHAHHLVGWFAKHEICPVSGCNCRCQFDGIRKLQRPAMKEQATSTVNVETDL